MKTKIVLQGKEQSFGEFEKELNEIVTDIENQYPDAVVDLRPTCAADGRMTVLIQIIPMLEMVQRFTNPKVLSALKIAIQKANNAN